MSRIRNHLCALAIWMSMWTYSMASRLNREAVEALLRPPKPKEKQVLKVYVAASKAEVGRAREMVLRLEAILGVQVVSRWHDVYLDGSPDPDAHAEAERVLNDNVADLRRADLLVALTCETAGRGVYCEVGRALERGMDVVWSLERDGRAIDWADEQVLVAYTDEAAVALVAELSASQARYPKRPSTRLAA